MPGARMSTRRRARQLNLILMPSKESATRNAVPRARSCRSVTGAGFRDGNPRRHSGTPGTRDHMGGRAVSLPDREHRPKKSTLAHAEMGWIVFAP
jgi:hypothetical protein